MDQNQRAYVASVDAYDSYALEAPEMAILERFASDWGRFKLLDIGVGTGRTTLTLASIVAEYVGIDYVQEMLDRCVRVCGEADNTRFEFGDARDLSRFADAYFDFVLFSLNGIDSVSHEDRLRILREVRRICKPDGHFCFSTHNIASFMSGNGRKRSGGGLRPRSALRSLGSAIHRIRLRHRYSSADIGELRSRPWAVLVTGDHSFRIAAYHIRPSYQVEQLEETGWIVDTVYDPEGAISDVNDGAPHAWLYFLCRPA